MQLLIDAGMLVQEKDSGVRVCAERSAAMLSLTAFRAHCTRGRRSDQGMPRGLHSA